MSTSEIKNIFLAVGSDHTGRGNVEISQVGVSLSVPAS